MVIFYKVWDNSFYVLKQSLNYEQIEKDEHKYLPLVVFSDYLWLIIIRWDFFGKLSEKFRISSHHVFLLALVNSIGHNVGFWPLNSNTVVLE